jgi:hypothetical protein
LPKRLPCQSAASQLPNRPAGDGGDVSASFIDLRSDRG